MKNPWYLPFNSKPNKLFCCRVTIADNSKRQIPTHLLVVHSMDLQPLTLDLSKALVLVAHSMGPQPHACVLSKDQVLVVHSMDSQPLALDLSKALVLLLHSTHLRRCALVLSKDWVELDDVSLDHRLSPLS